MHTCPTTQEDSSNSIVVSYANRITNPQMTQVPFDQVVEEIRTSTELARAISIVRAEPDDDRRNLLKKKHLSYWCPAIYKDGKRENDTFQFANLIVVDSDHLSVEELASAVRKAKENPFVLSAFISPSGDGIKVVFVLDRPVRTDPEYRRVFRYCQSYVLENITGECDTHNDPARACFLSSDPDIYHNPNSEKISVNEALAKEAESEANSTSKPKKKNKLSKALEGAEPGNRTHNMTSLIGLYMSKGFDRSATLEFIRAWNQGNKPPHDDSKLVSTVNEMFDLYDKESKKLPVQFIEKNNSYYKKDTMVTSFTIQPRELLVLNNNDCLVCDITSSQGYEYKQILLESADWHSKLSNATSFTRERHFYSPT